MVQSTPAAKPPRQNLPLSTLAPIAPVQQRLMRTQRAVGEPPPTTRETEDRSVHNCGRCVHEDEAAARRQQIMQMAERRADIAYRVQRADDEVERSCGKILIGARFFEIENLALDFGERGQLLQRAGKEARRDVGERVGCRPRSSNGSTCAARPACRRRFRGCAIRGLPEDGARLPAQPRRSRPASDSLRGRRRRIDRAAPRPRRKTAPARRPFPTQNRAEFSAISRAEQSLGQMAGVLGDEDSQRFLGRIRRSGKCRSRAYRC